jgi:hypothetical protein
MASRGEDVDTNLVVIALHPHVLLPGLDRRKVKRWGEHSHC